MTPDEEPERSFEEDLTRLEEVVRAMEAGDVPLDEAFDRFEEGVRLARILRKRLEEVEGRVQELLEDGSLRDFDAPSEGGP